MGHFQCLTALNEHEHPSFLLYNYGSHMISIQWAKFKQKSMFNFISAKLP